MQRNWNRPVLVIFRIDRLRQVGETEWRHALNPFPSYAEWLTARREHTHIWAAREKPCHNLSAGRYNVLAVVEHHEQVFRPQEGAQPVER